MCNICRNSEFGHVPKAPSKGETRQKNNTMLFTCFFNKNQSLGSSSLGLCQTQLAFFPHCSVSTFF